MSARVVRGGVCAVWWGVVGLWPLAQAAEGIAVPVVQVATQTQGQGLMLEGTLQAVRQSTLSVQASGRILLLNVKAGDRVRAGQVLASVDDRLTQAGIGQAQAQVAQADAQLENARANLKRTQDLHAQGFISRSALDSAEAQFRSAQAGSQGAQAGRVQSQIAQGFTRLTAPYDGWVLQTHADVGDVAQPGSPIVTVYAPQPMRAVVHVPGSRQAEALAATTLDVRLPDGRWVQPSERTRVPAADPVSQTVEWRLGLAAAVSNDLVPGQPVQVRFVGGAAPTTPATEGKASVSSRLTVPASAVVRRGELTAVYVQRTGQAAAASGFVLRAVRVGAGADKAAVEVLAGLKPGEWVAVDGARAGLQGAHAATAATRQP